MDIRAQKLTRARIKQAMDANSITRREYDLLLQLSDTDLAALVAAYEDGKFVGFGTIWHNQFTQWADLQRSEIVAELETLHRERLARRAPQVRGQRQSGRGPGRTAAYAAGANLSKEEMDKMWDGLDVRVYGLRIVMDPDGTINFVPNK